MTWVWGAACYAGAVLLVVRWWSRCAKRNRPDELPEAKDALPVKLPNGEDGVRPLVDSDEDAVRWLIEDSARRTA